MISAKANAAERCKSTLSENESVVRAASGDPVKKLVVDLSTQEGSYQQCPNDSRTGVGAST